MTNTLAPSCHHMAGEVRMVVHTNLGPLTVKMDVMAAMLTLRELTVAIHQSLTFLSKSENETSDPPSETSHES